MFLKCGSPGRFLGSIHVPSPLWFYLLQQVAMGFVEKGKERVKDRAWKVSVGPSCITSAICIGQNSVIWTHLSVSALGAMARGVPG